MTRILHLSDTHVSATGFDAQGVDAVASLERILLDAGDLPAIDLVLVTGDIADDGSPAGCRAVGERVGEFAAARGIPHVYTTGNHDDRDAFAEALGSGHLGPDGADRGVLLDPSVGTRAAVSEVQGLRVITLDSLVPGKVHGHLDRRQLDWLSDLLETPAERGTVIALHHPPLRLPAIAWFESFVLENINDLADAVRGRDVSAILAGHVHFQISGFLAGVPVSVAPGVVTRIDPTAPPHLVRGVLGAGASVVDLADPVTPSFHTIHARDPRSGEQVYVYDPVAQGITREERPRSAR
jgi:3',5'-cyclic-AMP phosphodiesterase